MTAAESIPLPLDPPPNVPAGNLAESIVPDLMSLAANTGILAESKIPEVIFDVARSGIALVPNAAMNAASTSAVIIELTCAESMSLDPPPPVVNVPTGNLAESIVPVTISEALSPGILSESIVPDAISVAANTGILAESSVPELIWSALIDLLVKVSVELAVI